MADSRFFNRQGPFTLADIATAIGAELVAPDRGIMTVEDVAALDQAGPSNITFIDNPKWRDSFYATKAGACIMRADMVGRAPAGTACLVTPTPYKAYALAAQMFYPLPKPVPLISDRAIIDPTAKIAPGCRIEPGAIIGAGAEIGEDAWISSNAVIDANVVIGPQCFVGAGASISHAIIGRNVRLYPGVRIGQDGFGFAIDPKGFVKVPQLGRVIIEDFCEVGANTCIDRGAGPDTIIGMGTWIDNLVQVGHNVKVGRACVIVSQVGIAGSTVIEDYVAIGGQVGITGHLSIGKGAQIAARSGVISDVPAGATFMGYPALPKTQFMRHVAYLNRATRPRRPLSPQDEE